MRIIFENGAIIEAEQNGSCFITAGKPMFPAPLGRVKIEGDEPQTIEHARLVECASVDGRYWFTFIETPQDELYRTMMEDALCEIDEANEERIAAIEDALCEIDAGGN